jgi:hypothetical protein
MALPVADWRLGKFPHPLEGMKEVAVSSGEYALEV